MITFKANLFRNPHHMSAFRKIMDIPVGAKVSYRINKIAKALDKERNAAQTKAKKVLKSFGVLDDKGVAKIVPGTQNFDIPEEKMEEFNAAMEAIYLADVSIDEMPIPTKEIEHAHLSANEWETLEAFTHQLSEA
jgi:hypothetical protein